MISSHLYVLFFRYKRYNVFYCFGEGDFFIAVVDVDEFIFVVTHVQLFHVGKLAQAVAGFHAFNQRVAVFFLHSINKVNACLVNR